MSENLHDIDKLFKDGIEGQQQMPSGRVWDAIDNNLDKTKIIQIKRKYNNLKRLAISLLLLLSAAVVYEIKTKNSLREELVKNTYDKGNNATNNTAKTDNLNKVVNKTTGKNTTSTPDATQQSISNNKEVNNATINDLKNTATGAERKVAKENAINPQQKAAVNFKNNRVNVIDNNDEALLSKSTVKKSSAQRTKIKIKNATAAEDVVTDNETTVDKDAALSFADRLTGLQENNTEKINANIVKNDLAKIDLRRNSTDAVATAAKNKSAKSKHPFHLSVIPFYAPQFAFNHIEEDNKTPAPPSRPGGPPSNWREEIRNQEQHQTASSFGILVELPVNKRWSIQSGVTYLQKKIDIEPKKIYAILDNDGKVRYRFDCSSGYTYLTDKTGTTPVVGDSISTISSSNTLGYIGIPLAINYNINAGKLVIRPAVGAVINLLTKQKIEAELVKGSTKETQTFDHIHGLRPNYFTATTGVALEYNLSKKVALNVTPSASFALSSITKNAIVRSYPNSFGVAAGVRIKF